MHMRNLIIGAALAAGSTAAHAAPAWALDVNTTSYHTQAWAREQLSQVNPGLGLEYRVSPDWSAMGGFYRNSYSRTTAYALAAWTPLRFNLPAGLRIDAGLAVGLVSGYRRSEVPTAPLAAGAVLHLRTARGFGKKII